MPDTTGAGAPMSPHVLTPEGASRSPSTVGVLVRRELGRARGALALAAVSTVGMAATDLLRPWPVKLVLDYVLLDVPLPPMLAPAAGLLAMGKVPAILICAGAIVLIALVTGAFAYWQVHFTTKIGNDMVHALRRHLFAHLQRLSLAFHARARSGELLTTMASDTAALRDTFSESVLTLGSHTLTVFGIVVVLFVLNWRLALVVLATVPFLCWNIVRLFARTRRTAQARRRKEERLATQFQEVFSSVSMVQAFGRERHEHAKFEAENDAYLGDAVRAARLEALSARGVELIGAAATAVVVAVGAMEVLAGRLTVGAVLVFTSYLHGLYRPMRNIAKLSAKMAKSQVSAERISTILSTEPESDDPPHARTAEGLRGEIVFEHVSFGYDAGHPVLRDVTLRIAPNQRVAVVGRSGAGKSTLLGLLLRLYRPTRGRILVDGVDILDYARESLRAQMAVVLQDAVVFGASVRENIAYGKLNATDDEIVAAARDAHAHEFIMALDRGYDAVLGARGATLSGGQRQRLAMARAMIRPASVLLLDEPMTGLVGQTEAHVHDALVRLAAGKTSVLITHDLRTVADADLVVVLDHGSVVAQGRHEDLLIRSGWYRQFCQVGTQGRSRSGDRTAAAVPAS
jgi:ATP-binding cassette subfamily B protein